MKFSYNTIKIIIFNKYLFNFYNINIKFFIILFIKKFIIINIIFL